MSFNPEDYTFEDKPEEWYEQWPGRIIGHVSLFRDLLDGSFVEEYAEELDLQGPVEHFIHRVYLELGYWVTEPNGNKLFVTGHHRAEGIVLGLDESDPDEPKAMLGDYLEFKGRSESPIVRSDIVTKKLSEIGVIFAGSSLPNQQGIPEED